MKVGDMVSYQKASILSTGIVIETGLDVGVEQLVVVMWEDGTLFTERARSLKVISEGR